MACGDDQTHFKRCLVPECDVSSMTNPTARFFEIPRYEPDLTIWKSAMHADLNNALNLAVGYCCEFHFDVSIILKSLL